MTQVVVGRPLEEFKARIEDGTKPDAVLHLLRCKTFAPAAATGFGQIHKRALISIQSLELSERLAR